MMKLPTLLYLVQCSAVFFRLQTFGNAQEQQFYCDDSSDALDFVPAERTCVNLSGQNRCWFTYLPEEDVEEETIPLVLDLHGFTACAQSQPTYTGWREIGYEENVAVIWPQGTNNIFYSLVPCWNAGSCCCYSSRSIPDSDFLMDIIQTTLDENPQIDPKRVYIAGHSNGCFMSQRFVADHPGVVAAVACHAGVMLLDHPDDDDSDWIPTTIVNIHGDADDVVPYDTTPFYLGAEENNDLWGASNGCTKKEVVTDSSNEFVTHTWSGCDGGVSTRLIQVLGANHNPYASEGYVDTTSMAWNYIKNITLTPDCSRNIPYVTVEVTTDENPSETSWKLSRDGDVVLESDPYDEANFKYTKGFCPPPIPNSCYSFEILDSGGDGLTDSGGYAIYANGNVVAEGLFNIGFIESVNLNCGP